MGKEDRTLTRFIPVPQIFQNESVPEPTWIGARKFCRFGDLDEQHNTLRTRVRVPAKV